jgi:hypothetical protein
MSELVEKAKEADLEYADIDSDAAAGESVDPAQKKAAKEKLDKAIQNIKDEIAKLKEDSKGASMSDLEAIETTLQELEDAVEMYGNSGGRRRRRRKTRRHGGRRRHAKKSRKSRK